MDVGCALAAQLLAREQTWRDEHATYVGLNNDLARFHTLSHAPGYVTLIHGDTRKSDAGRG